MDNGVTQEQKSLLQKFGFSIEGSQVVHKKTGLAKDIAAFRDIASLSELEEYIKSLLRNQCKFGR